jgi:O-antigen/teichoic acid export membrane protein
MSRLRKFAHSLASGYLLLGVNAAYTLASVPLALHYLSNEEFGLWALITQIASLKLMLVDFGMTASISRILIDHKDNPSSAHYGSVIQTGFWVLAVQGILIAIAGSGISFWLPDWMNLPGQFWHVFRWLLIGESLLLGATFSGRMFGFILSAHQRYDLPNYSAMGSFIVNLAVLWLGFKWHMGLYSLLLAYAVSLLFGIIFTGIAVRQLGLLPGKANRGRLNSTTFKELFFYGTDFFLLSIGNQLIFASQVPVITRVLGLEAAATWSIASKLFMLAQQVVFKIIYYASGAQAEMMVRDERERLKSRFRDLIILAGAASVVICLAVALCNESFLKIWTHGRIFWGFKNDLLFALMMIIYSNSYCFAGLIAMTKKIRAMKYIYFIEGVLFVLFSILLARSFGLAGVMVSAIVTDLLCGGFYSVRRVTDYFKISFREILLAWYKNTYLLLGAMSAGTLLVWEFTRPLAALPQLLVGATGISLIGVCLFWRLGLNQPLRDEAGQILRKIKNKLRPA